MRLRVDVSYEGTDFHGWAIQPGLRTVQGDLESALATTLRCEAPRLTCAGRTDTGVHARGQVVHLDLEAGLLEQSVGRSSDTPEDALRRRLNGVLGTDVRVRRVAVAPADFDARFSALWRRYTYRVCDDQSGLDPLLRRHVVSWSRPLDLAAMAEASAGLVGPHDFAAYCRRREGATTIRTLLDLTWERTPEGWAVATVRADAFCHGMVRALVGAVLQAGEGRKPPSWPGEFLAERSRVGGAPLAPPHGLTLEEVAYPPDAHLGARVELTRARRTVAAVAEQRGTPNEPAASPGEVEQAP